MYKNYTTLQQLIASYSELYSNPNVLDLSATLIEYLSPKAVDLMSNSDYLIKEYHSQGSNEYITLPQDCIAVVSVIDNVHNETYFGRPCIGIIPFTLEKNGVIKMQKPSENITIIYSSDLTNTLGTLLVPHTSNIVDYFHYEIMFRLTLLGDRNPMNLAPINLQQVLNAAKASAVSDVIHMNMLSDFSLAKSTHNLITLVR